MEKLSVEMKKTNPNTSTHIPTELIEITLSKLPVRSLNRFLRASKEWYNTISATHFVSAHLLFTNSLQDKTTLFLIDFKIPHNKISCVLYSDDDKILNIHAIPRAPLESLSVIGCANGLLCLFDSNQLVLWNPSIQKCLHLPDSPISSRPHSWSLAFGIVFDQINNDFKVLRLYRVGLGTFLEIYRLSTGLWEHWTKEIPFIDIYIGDVVLNGLAHWLGADEEEKLMIVSFDVHKEVFGSIAPPEPLAEDNGTNWDEQYTVCLFLFEESLVLIHYGDEFDANVGKSRTRYDFWKMEEYGKAESWKLWHSIYCHVRWCPLGFRKNGQFLWDDEKRREFVSTNLENFSVTYLGRYKSGRI